MKRLYYDINMILKELKDINKGFVCGRAILSNFSLSHRISSSPKLFHLLSKQLKIDKSQIRCT